MPPVKSPRRKNKAAKARRRLLPRWLRSNQRLVLSVGSAMIVTAAALWLIASGAGTKAVDGTVDTFFKLTADAGLKVNHVLVSGRQRLSRKSAENAIGARRGMPILAFDPHAAKSRLEKFAWIKSATVERRIPDTIYVRLHERRPLALWQFKGRFAVIDGDGVVVARSRLAAYRSLPLVVGADAPRHAGEMISILQAHDGLREHVEALVRVSKRRWDLKFKNGVTARLPERDPGRAVATLARLIRRDKLLERDIVMIDLRFNDRLVVRRSPETGKSSSRSNNKRRPAESGPSKDT